LDGGLRQWPGLPSAGLSDTGEILSPTDGERIVGLVAHHVGAEVHARSPRVSAELPDTGERFEGLLPPVVAGPAFAIRKPAVAVFTVDDYVAPESCPPPCPALLVFCAETSTLSATPLTCPGAMVRLKVRSTA